MLLYTPEDVTEDCFNTSLNCFVSEMKVVDYEFKLICKIIVEFSPFLANAERFENYKSKNSCTTCEEFQEQNITVFLNAFVTLLQNYLKTSTQTYS
ncbi:interleukin-15 [Amblyraja radiata]|uniref:interleukin-15 n=1 Tax=Amblyraja radiata TaxID=386614 RepID=UPI001403461C|nr:interleukin-15 [Amblyraja radiata]